MGLEIGWDLPMGRMMSMILVVIIRTHCIDLACLMSGAGVISVCMSFHDRFCVFRCVSRCVYVDVMLYLCVPKVK